MFRLIICYIMHIINLSHAQGREEERAVPGGGRRHAPPQKNHINTWFMLLSYSCYTQCVFSFRSVPTFYLLVILGPIHFWRQVRGGAGQGKGATTSNRGSVNATARGKHSNVYGRTGQSMGPQARVAACGLRERRGPTIYNEGINIILILYRLGGAALPPRP